jgi:hypothetical protein
MWNPLKSTSKDADIYAAYEWPETMAYCIRMKLYETNGKHSWDERKRHNWFSWKLKLCSHTVGEKAVITGNCYGEILVYDVGNGVRSKTLRNGSKERLPPKRVCIFQMCARISLLQTLISVLLDL